MESAMGNIRRISEDSRDIGRRLLTIGENRLELLVLELQEERERLVRALLISLSVAVLGLLAGITLTATIVVLLWEHSPAAILATLTGIYLFATVGLYWHLAGLLRSWQVLAGTLDQLKKDRACFVDVLK